MPPPPFTVTDPRSPLVHELDAALRPIRHCHPGDHGAIEAKVRMVAAQGEAVP